MTIYFKLIQDPATDIILAWLSVVEKLPPLLLNNVITMNYLHLIDHLMLFLKEKKPKKLNNR